MKAIILAAGQGKRLDKYTKDLPKGMLSFVGKTLIERQIDNFSDLGMNDISVVVGYLADKITYENVKYYYNPDYQITNMVESLFCAEKEFNDDLIISYVDIVYEKKVLAGLMDKPGQVIVTVDMGWEKYWKVRYGEIFHDTESLKLNDDGAIKEIGRQKPFADQIDARYVGLIKFSLEGIKYCQTTYHKEKKKYWNKLWQISGKIFQQAYMTDMIQALIDSGLKVNSYPINGGWLEFDTNQDYEKMVSMLNDDSLLQLIDLSR